MSKLNSRYIKHLDIKRQTLRRKQRLFLSLWVEKNVKHRERQKNLFKISLYQNIHKQSKSKKREIVICNTGKEKYSRHTQILANPKATVTAIVGQRSEQAIHKSRNSGVHKACEIIVNLINNPISAN